MKINKKMSDSNNSPFKTNENSEIINDNFKKYRNLSYNSKLNSKIFYRPYCFKCNYCHFCGHHHKKSRNISYSQINHINPIELEASQKHNYSRFRNNSMNNLLRNQYNIYYSNDKENKDYNLYDDRIRNIKSLKDINLKRVKTENNRNFFLNKRYKNNEIYNSYKDLNIIENNKNINIIGNKFRHINSVKIDRKKLSKYYSIKGPKKYSEWGNQLLTESNANNNRYKEIFRISGSKEENLNRNRPIYYNKNNYYDFTFGNNPIISNNNINNRNNYNYVNYRYKSLQNSPKYMIKNNLCKQKEANNELKSSKLIKETYDKRLVNLKDIKQSLTEKKLFNSNDKSEYKNNLNFDYSYIKSVSDLYLQNKMLYSQNILNTNNINNQKGLNENNNKTPYNNFNNINLNKPNFRSITKSYSVNNIIQNKDRNINPNNIKSNLKNDHIFVYNNINKKKSNNNNFEIFKQKVKLALMKIQRTKQENNKDSNNGNNRINKRNLYNKKYLEKFLTKNNKKPIITNYKISLLEKTKKILEEKRTKNSKKQLNNINIENYRENRDVNDLRKNLGAKNINRNKYKIKKKIKI